jgi:hypothetical protein
MCAATPVCTLRSAAQAEGNAGSGAAPDLTFAFVVSFVVRSIFAIAILRRLGKTGDGNRESGVGRQ